MKFIGIGVWVLATLLQLCLPLPAQAHPEDEFCTADSGLDPALCAALAEADRALATGLDGLPDRPGEIRLDRPWPQTAALYVELGFVHILPRGLDHILFVLALFLASTRLGPLFIQVSVFTLAHTVTLALAATGTVTAPPGLVEPLIALSIAFVAIENLVWRDMTPWRPFLVFGFGLFHGLGFAGVLLDLGLPDNQFVTALVAFNVGVELGQLTVVAAAWLLLHWWFRRPWYRPAIVVPASLVIAQVGVYWAFDRMVG